MLTSDAGRYRSLLRVTFSTPHLQQPGVVGWGEVPPEQPHPRLAVSRASRVGGRPPARLLLPGT